MRKFKSLAASVLVLATVAGASFSGSALAQAYPSKTIKFVVPYSAGGLPDTVARLVANRLQEGLGQTVVVENKPGANGAVAAASLATTPADGYTFLVTDGSMMTINPLTNKKLAYDPVKDFEPVSLVANSPLFLAVNSSVKANTLDEFIALAKAKPGAINYGSSGTGSSHHLTAEAMKAALGIFMTHIPYRGSGASVPALVGQQVDMVFAAYPSLAPFDKAGRVRILATNSLQRSVLAPDVPAISEKIPGFDFAVLIGIFAPAGTPKEAIQRVSAEVAKIAKRPEVIEQMKVAGIEMLGGGPAELNKAIDAERGRMVKAVKHANIKD
jgi:tripartite-type tricarboxylate transporter receptor subunit TctC